MKKCELCGGSARMHCESDQANLCWDCDLKVHGANFLVAKHTRTLLCHVCQNPTPWLATGHNLTPAVSVCPPCVGENDRRTNYGSQAMAQQEESSEEEYEDEGDDDDDEDEEEVEDGENQVVPWSSSVSNSKSVASMDSMSSSECDFGSKRMRYNNSFYSDDEIGCSSSHIGSARSSNGEATSINSSRLLKLPRLSGADQSARNQDRAEADSRSSAIINSLKRLQKHTITNDGDASATILGICRLSRDQSQ